MPDSASAQNSLPHLVFIMADHLRCDALGAYGSRNPVTPKLDLLAKRATLFEHHYTTCPLCVPARSSIMTGLYPHQNGTIINGWRGVEREFGFVRTHDTPLPQRLADAGYHVIHAGIQHVRTTPDFKLRCPDVHFVGPEAPASHYKKLFTERKLYVGDQSKFREPVIDYVAGKPVVSTATSVRTDVFPLIEDHFFDVALTQHIVDAIKARDKSKPLALFAMYWLPHPPLRPPQKWAELIHPDDVVLPTGLGQWYSGQPAMQLQNIPGRLGANVTIEQWREVWAAYLGLVGLFDQCASRILSSLDHAKLLDDAAVMLTSDHGDMLGNHAMFQKMCCYEEAARVPLLVKMPGQTRRRRTRQLTSHIDLTATLLDLAQAKPIRHSDGRSFATLASGREPSTPFRDFVYASYDGNTGRGFAHRMIRSATHKYIHNHQDRPELYDLIDDPRETKNLADREDQAKLRMHLHQQLATWMKHCGDTLPISV